MVANAGISGGHGKIGDETEQRLRDIMATNIDGMFNTVNPLIDRLRGRKRGQIALWVMLGLFIVLMVWAPDVARGMAVLFASGAAWLPSLLA